MNRAPDRARRDRPGRARLSVRENARAALVGLLSAVALLAISLLPLVNELARADVGASILGIQLAASAAPLGSLGGVVGWALLRRFPGRYWLGAIAASGGAALAVAGVLADTAWFLGIANAIAGLGASALFVVQAEVLERQTHERGAFNAVLAVSEIAAFTTLYLAAGMLGHREWRLPHVVFGVAMFAAGLVTASWRLLPRAVGSRVAGYPPRRLLQQRALRPELLGAFGIFACLGVWYGVLGQLLAPYGGPVAVALMGVGRLVAAPLLVPWGPAAQGNRQHAATVAARWIAVPFCVTLVVLVRGWTGSGLVASLAAGTAIIALASDGAYLAVKTSLVEGRRRAAAYLVLVGDRALGLQAGTAIAGVGPEGATAVAVVLALGAAFTVGRWVMERSRFGLRGGLEAVSLELRLAEGVEHCFARSAELLQGWELGKADRVSVLRHEDETTIASFRVFPSLWRDLPRRGRRGGRHHVPPGFERREEYFVREVLPSRRRRRVRVWDAAGRLRGILAHDKLRPGDVIEVWIDPGDPDRIRIVLRTSELRRRFTVQAELHRAGRGRRWPGGGPSPVNLDGRPLRRNLFLPSGAALLQLGTLEETERMRILDTLGSLRGLDLPRWTEPIALDIPPRDRAVTVRLAWCSEPGRAEEHALALALIERGAPAPGGTASQLPTPAWEVVPTVVPPAQWEVAHIVVGRVLADGTIADHARLQRLLEEAVTRHPRRRH